MNIKILFKNYKKYISKNFSQKKTRLIYLNLIKILLSKKTIGL